MESGERHEMPSDCLCPILGISAWIENLLTFDAVGKRDGFNIQMRIFCNIQIRLFWKLMNAKGCRHRKKNPSFNNCQNYYPSLHSFWATLSSMSVHPFVPQQSCLLYDISSFSFSMIFSSLSFSVVLLLLRWPNILLLFLLLPWNTFLLKMFCSILYFIFLQVES